MWWDITSSDPHQLQITDFFSINGNLSGDVNTCRAIIGATDNKALREYAAYINELCGGKSTPGEVYRELRASRSSVTSRIISHYPRCTGEGTKPCHLLQDLTIWNEFLRLLDAELKELAPGKLGVVCLGSSSLSEWKNSDRRHPSILLHWLLKEHHCIKTLELKQVVVPGKPRILCDALRLSTGLTRLKLSDYGWPGDTSLHLVTAVLTIAQLEELELAKVNVSKDALASLANALGGMKHLRSLAIYFLDGSGDYIGPLLKGLSKNATITTLKVDSHCFAPEGGKVFEKYLAQNAILQGLTIEHDMYGHHAEFNVTGLARALETNKVLKKLSLGSFDKEESRGKLFVEAMSKNTTLQHLHFSSLPWDLDVEVLAELIEKNTGLSHLEVSYSSACAVAPLAAAIKQNVSMRQLALHLSVSNHDNAKLFVEALASNKSLELVTICDVDETSVPDLYRLLQETGTEARVKFCAAIEDPTCLASTLKNCPKLTDVSYDPCDDLEPGSCINGLEQLVSCHHLVKLWLGLDEDIETECARSLASFLSSTKTLKDFHLSLETSAQTTQILLGGLSCNRSITLMSLEYWSFQHCHVGLFKAMLEGNMMLRDLSVESADDTVSLSVLERLPECLLNNYSLLNVGLNKCLEFKTCIFQVQDILRRNLSFLNRAAEFVVGLHSKHSANAFERLYRNETLATKVQDLTCETAPEVQQMIRSSASYLDANFLAIVGVVERSVACDRGSQCGGQVQFDQLGLDNWLKIRSYLRVSDIREGVTKHSVSSTRCERKRKFC
ncbi:unnamed protein product [Ixodes hexagonus]